MQKTIKKIVLFLFGIVLVVFGNKAAINTIFKGEEKPEEASSASEDTDIKASVITDEVPANTEVSEPIEKTEISHEQNKTTSAQPEKVKEQKTVETTQPRKTEAKSEAPSTQTSKIEEQEPAQEEKKEVVKETPATTIEPEKSEEASGSE